MATPKTFTAGVTPVSAAYLNKYISGNGTKVEIKTLYATIIYSAGNIVVDSSSDSCGIVTGDLNYNAGTDVLEITISGFVNRPQVQLTRISSGTNYLPAYLPVDNTEVDVEFYDPADLTSKATPGAVDAHMNFTLFIIGY